MTLREQYERLKREMAKWPKWMRETPPDFRSEDERRAARGLGPEDER